MSAHPGRPPRLTGTVSRILPAALALVVLATATACTRRAEQQRGAAAAMADQTVNLTVGGRVRSYLLHRPAGAAPTASLPAVLVFHGGGGSPEQMAAESGFDAAADRAGFVAVYPAGYEHSWNDLRTGDTKANLAGVDDLAFVSAVVDQLVASDHVDPAHVYATGMSNGGMFTETLGCRLGGTKIAGIAPVSGTMAGEVRDGCRPAKPLPVLEIHGTDDPIVPFDGGHVAITSGTGRPGPATVLSVADTQAVWRGLDGCGGAPVVKQLPDTQADGTRVSVDTAGGCGGGVAVSLYTIAGGGHTWPGGSQYLPVAVVGRVTHQIRGTDVIMAFFQADLARR